MSRQLLREAIAIGCGLGELAIEMGLALAELGGRGGQCGVVALVRIAQSGLASGNGLLERVASRLNVGKLRRERCFAFGQALDVGSGRSVVLPCLLEGGVGVAQLLCEAVASSRGLRQLTIEMGLALVELGGRGGQRGIVSLLRVAQSGLAVGNGLLERDARRALSPELSVELRLSYRCLLADFETLTRRTSDGVLECGFRRGQSTFEIGTAGNDVAESGLEIYLQRRKALDVSRL